MTRCGIDLRRMGTDASSMEDVAQRSVRYLHTRLADPELATPACALVRTFITLPYSRLQPDQQRFADSVLDSTPAPTMKCLTLLATTGDEAPWNSRYSSAAHKALPLPSAAGIARSPMIAQLIRQLGVEVDTLLAPSGELLIDDAQAGFNVFYVADAVGSPYIPAQREFVVPHRIRSVLGFGGLLPTGDLFATILFAKHHIPRTVADLFRTLALNMKVALLPFADGRVFE
jgi:two-component system NtrC family sensor kinase